MDDFIVMSHNILFIADSDRIDYQCHCLFHGLCELSSITVYLLNDLPYMFSDYPIENRASLYGMGFSISCRISPQKRKMHDAQTARDNIKKLFYDIIIYGGIDRCLDLWDVVKLYYNRTEIICVEGSDFMHPYLNAKLYLGSLDARCHLRWP